VFQGRWADIEETVRANFGGVRVTATPAESTRGHVQEAIVTVGRTSVAVRINSAEVER